MENNIFLIYSKQALGHGSFNNVKDIIWIQLEVMQDLVSHDRVDEIAKLKALLVQKKALFVDWPRPLGLKRSVFRDSGWMGKYLRSQNDY